jgi:hypothetical protein
VTDNVERLRDIARLEDVPPDFQQIQWLLDAADEIERLRSHVAKLEAWEQEGEALLGENASLRLGAMFRFGEWWADRPWRRRDDDL